MTTKIVALTDALGQLVRFRLLPGHRYDTLAVGDLIEGVTFGALLADQAYDANWIIEEVHARGAVAVIELHRRRANVPKIDREVYKWRHLIENFFGKLKEFKRIALRSDKLDQTFETIIALAACVIRTR